MTPELQEKILDTHNKLRNRQAKGETPGYDAAARMGTVHWDNDLAKFAETRARECLGFHDQCRSTGKLIISNKCTSLNQLIYWIFRAISICWSKCLQITTPNFDRYSIG